jgi:uridine kinase
METGRRANLRTVLVRTGHAGQDGRFPFSPDYVVTDLTAAISWILEGHPALLGRMAPVVAAAAGARMVVIGGLARAGKSSAAQVLKEAISALGRTAHVIAIDSWLKPVARRSEATGVTARYDVEDMLATLARIVRHPERIALELPVYDRANRTMYQRRRHLQVDPEDVLIVEGVPALLVDGLVALADVPVQMEMPESERVSRLRADYRWRGTSDTAVHALLESRAIDESEPVNQAKVRADFVIDAWTAA